MDSLKLDRFRRLLNRQNTSINLGDGQQQTTTAANASAGTSGGESQSNATNRISSVSKTTAAGLSTTTAQSSFSAITQVSLPEYITKDSPKPAHFIARKLFCDFTALAHRKIDLVLGQVDQQNQHQHHHPHSRSTKSHSVANSTSAGGSSQHHNQQQHQQQKQRSLPRDYHPHSSSLFKSLQREEDLVYDQILQGLGIASEYCLPSLLKYLLLWYHQQLDAYADRASSPPPLAGPDADCALSSPPPPKCQQDEHHQHHHQLLQSQDSDLGTKTLYQSTEISSSNQANQEQSATQNCDQQHPQAAAECGCVSPCNNESHSFSSSAPGLAMRSPTPASPDLSATSNQISITSTLPLEYQTPAPQTTIIQKEPESQQQQQSAKDAVNTSTSTATNTSLNSTSLEDSINLMRRSEILSTRTLLLEYTFCQALIEIFNKLYLHPGHEDLIGQVEEISFEHFRHFTGTCEQDSKAADAADVKRLAEKFAEVLGVLAQTRFRSVKKRFLAELAERKAREPTTENIQSVCSLLAGMRSFRIKMAPIEEFEASLGFLQELADYFVEVRHKSIKHALAELFVEILLPLASIVKNEVKIPCLKNFVDTLWAPTLDMCARKKHSASLFPLVTCLLCVSQRALFLANWAPFLTMCLSNLKNRDPKMCRIALESLYRLIWIYMIRIKGESNNVTQARLSTIVDSLFPRGSRQIVPREAQQLVIFVDIIQFIAQERLDFAMRHIIFDLLSVDRSIKLIMAPERMNIGLQAFLVIADSLQQKECDSAMPISIGSASAQQLAHIMHPPTDSTTTPLGFGARRLGSGSGSGAHKMLNDETAKSIGLHPYHGPVQKSFSEIIRALDAQFGRPLMLTSLHASTAAAVDGLGASGRHAKEPDADGLISGDRRLRVDLFKTCIAAIPRLMPDGMPKGDLIDLLARMTIHVDEEMRRYAFESLRKLVLDFQDWRLDAIEGFTLFLANQIDESLWHLVDGALKMLLQLLISWHSIITSTTTSICGGGANTGLGSSESDAANGNGSGNGAQGGSTLLARATNSIVTIQTGYETISSRNSGTGGQIAARKNRALAEMRLIQSELSNTRFDRLVNVIQKVEGASLVMLCSCHSTTRKLASLTLRECRAILRCYSSWTCMEQFGFRTPPIDYDGAGGGGGGAVATENGNGGGGGEEDNLSAVVSLKGSLSADNLSRITTNSINGLVHSSMTSINTQAAMLSTSVSKMCLGTGTGIGAGTMAGTNAFNTFGLGARSASVTNNNNNNNNTYRQRDLYDEDLVADGSAQAPGGGGGGGECDQSGDSSTVIFWVAVMMLESQRESEYAFALRLLKRLLPELPLGQEDFLEELERNLKHMQWDSFPGLHALVLKGCPSPSTYDLCISLLDHMTPVLGHAICTRQSTTSAAADAASVPTRSAAERALPAHVLVLSTYLLATYEDPSSLSMNIARRLALCCEENSSKLENLAAVMTLYSRRSFSKDAFQWIKCVAKYLHDACPEMLPRTIPLLLDLLATGPRQIQRLILPILYCILSYQQPATSTPAASPESTHEANFNEQVLMRLYTKCLGSVPLWRDAMQIFRLIISKSSSLASSSGSAKSSTGPGELPGRTMDFSLEIESVPIIAKARLGELGIFPNPAPAAATHCCPSTAVATPASAHAKCQQKPASQQHSVAADDGPV